MDVVPQELRSLDQWITWRLEGDTKKPNCKWQERANQVAHSDISWCERIGFVFTDSDGLCGIDLDYCVEGGKINESVSHIVEKFRGVAYAEISPSGSGIKFFTKAKKPEGSRCANHVDGVECYDSGRWFAVTRQMLPGFESIGDGQAAVDWLCSEYLSQPVATTSPTRWQDMKFSKGSLNERALEYINAAERPNVGGRNNCGFRLAGHLFAMRDRGELLGLDGVMSFVLQWNSSLSAPMPEKEIEQFCRSAEKSPTPREEKHGGYVFESDLVDTSNLVESMLKGKISVDAIGNKLWGNEQQANADEELDSDEDFCEAMVPDSGLIRSVFDFYSKLAYRRSSVMGLAVALSLCETIFGRRICSHTDLRTNDYNLILATTGSGKEACEAAITKILEAADPDGAYQIPPDIQSGNGLMKAVSLNPCGIWVCDEFGKILQAVLDKKGNQHIKNIGLHLLKLYGKSNGTYGGAAHADGVRNKVREPHLVVLGLSTGSTVFDSVTSENVSDGLLGRIAFWPVQHRPEPAEDLEIVRPDESLIEKVASWIRFLPGGNLGAQFPKAEVFKMSTDAKVRWKEHARQIDARMRSESESRAAIWARVAARTMKLALVHRAARLETDPSATAFEFVNIEMHDVNWAIKLSNWLARIACGLVRENTVDRGLEKAKAILKQATADGPIGSREILRTFRSISAGDLESAAAELGYIVESIPTKSKGKPRKTYRRPTNVDSVPTNVGNESQ